VTAIALVSQEANARSGTLAEVVTHERGVDPRADRTDADHDVTLDRS
jgi:hypothetical protein